MFLWAYRCVRNAVSAVVALAGLIALAEVGLRIARLQEPDAASASAAIARDWLVPSDSTAFELPRVQRFRVTTPDGPVAWATNSWGFRGAEPAVPKPPGTYRIVCLGDAALLAPGLTEDQLLSSTLFQTLQRRTHSAIEVINAALPDACPLTQAIHYRLHVAALQPDLVLLHLDADDVTTDRRFRRWIVRDSAGQPLSCVHPDRRAAAKISLLHDYRQEFALVDWCFAKCSEMSPLKQPTVEPLSLGAPDDIVTAVEPTMLVQQLCQSSSGLLVVWMCPSRADDDVLQHHRALTQAAGNWFRSQSIPAIDSLGALQRHMVAETDGWTAEGHQRLGEFLAQQLMQNLAGPWTSPVAAETVLPASHEQPGTTGQIPEIRRPLR